MGMKVEKELQIQISENMQRVANVRSQEKQRAREERDCIDAKVRSEEDCVKEFRIDRAIRMVKQVGMFWDLLPPFPYSACQEWVVTVLQEWVWMVVTVLRIILLTMVLTYL